MGTRTFLSVNFCTKDPVEVVKVFCEVTEALSLIDVQLRSIRVKDSSSVVEIEQWKGATPIGENEFAIFLVKPITDLLPSGARSPHIQNMVNVEAYAHESVPEEDLVDLRRAFKNTILERFRHLNNCAVW